MNFVVHVDHPRFGWLEDWAAARFSDVCIIRAHRDPLPAVDKLSGPVVIMGGPMGVASIPELPWLAREAEWLGSLLVHRHPLLGICLGAQLIAHVLGHHVQPCPMGFIESGYYPVHSSHGLPSHVYQWHRDGILLDHDHPDAPLCLGVSDWQHRKATQAFVWGRALGVQFHPEVNAETIEAWLARDPHDLILPGARPAHTHLHDHLLHGPSVRRWLEGKLDQVWAGQLAIAP